MNGVYYIKLCCLLIICTASSIVHAQEGDGTLRRIRVPILMYHYISPLPEDADNVRIDLTVEPDMFKAHLQYLDDQDYTTITLNQVYDALMVGAPLPPKPVVLTFDDGYRDHYEYVFPALQEHGFIATFFVITGRADSGDPVYISWREIGEMAGAGMQMEAHTKNHLSLDERERDFLIFEMLSSRESLEGHTSTEANMFAYPAGRYDEETLEIADEVGFRLAVTTRPGMEHATTDRLELARVRVSGDTNISGLAYLLGGRWLE
jgi:peptidoglycan/xylan/chitin deacetylase (PgdA/CDA1 family)